MSEEIWKDIEGFPKYEISNKKRLRNKETGQFKKFTLDTSNGYEVANLFGPDGKSHRKYAHRLMAEAFLPNPEGKRTVNHKNGVKSCNDLSNFEWATDSEQMKHAFSIGLCENTRAAAREQIKVLQAMPKTDHQREVSRANILKVNSRPKTEKQLEAARRNAASPAFRENARESHFNRHPPIRLNNTGEIYRSQRELAEAIGLNESHICACLKGRRKNTTEYDFEYVTESVEEAKGKPFLYPFQMEAVKKAFVGCILNGGTGSGKSRTGLYFYFKEEGGWIDENGRIPMKNPRNLLIITTAAKRDKCEWEQELSHYHLSTNPEVNCYENEVKVDSWQNIKKYVDLTGWFVIFDEDKVCGTGAWARAFLKIAKNNDWIMLSATAGDKWEDYISVFIANGFYKNKTEFSREHLIYSRYSKFPKVERYVNTGRLLRLRSRILIDMDFDRHTIPHNEDVYCTYDISLYKDIMKKRWDPYKNEPLKQASELCYLLRKIVNSDESRQVKLLELLEDHPRAIIFYSYDYERDILLSLGYGEGVEVAEWTGHKHEPIPDSEKWVYLVNYASGAEGFNCIKTDTIIFYSQTYSYKTLVQAKGRIDRLNTPYSDLYYYHLKSRSGIDLAISKALQNKKKFNETKWVKW